MNSLKLYYNNCDDIPLYNWWAFVDSFNPDFMLVNNTAISSKFNHDTKVVFESFKAIGNQLVSKYGVSDMFLKVIKLKQYFIRLKNEQYNKGKRENEIFAEITLNDINKLKGKDSDKIKEDDLIAIGERIFKRPINSKDITLGQFHEYIDYLNRMPKPAVK